MKICNASRFVRECMYGWFLGGKCNVLILHEPKMQWTNNDNNGIATFWNVLWMHIFDGNWQNTFCKMQFMAVFKPFEFAYFAMLIAAKQTILVCHRIHVTQLEPRTFSKMMQMPQNCANWIICLICWNQFSREKKKRPSGKGFTRSGFFLTVEKPQNWWDDPGHNINYQYQAGLPKNFVGILKCR